MGSFNRKKLWPILIFAGVLYISPNILPDAFADQIIDTIPVPSGGVVVNSVTNKIYATSSVGLTVIDGSTNDIVGTIQVEPNHAGVAVNPSTNMIYVTHYDVYATSNRIGNVTVIDGSTDSVISKIQVGIDPLGVAVNHITNMIYVSDILGDEVFVIDGSTNSVVASIPVQDVEGLDVNPITNRIYATARCSLVVMDGASNTVMTTFPVSCPLPSHSLSVNPDTNKIYVSGRYSVIVVDGQTNEILGHTGSCPNNPAGINVNPNTNKIYVGCLSSDPLISIIDGSTDTPITNIALSGSPGGIGVNVNTNRIYVATSENITVIDGRSVPSEPQNLVATASLVPMRIDLNWDAPSNDGWTPITGYMIERSTDDGNTWSKIVEDTGSTDTAYSDTNVLPLTTYTYRVSAINAIGTSDPSNTASAEIPTVSILPVSLQQLELLEIL